MKKYRVYFEFYGKNMVTEVEAGSEALAKEKVIGRLKFVNVEIAGQANTNQPMPTPPPCPPERGNRWNDNTIFDFFNGFKKY